MHDDITSNLKHAASGDLSDDTPDLGWVLERGHVLRLRRLIGTAVIGLGAVALIVVVAVTSLPGASTIGPVIDKKPLPGRGPDQQPRHALIEPTTEQDRAEIFAFRAMAATGLMDPHGSRSYGFTYAEDTSQTGDGWQIGFAAMDCAPKKNSQTCKGSSGEDERGNAITDTYIGVRFEKKRWTVVSAEGNIPDEDRAKVVGYSLRQRREASHWEFPAVGVWDIGDESMISMVALWVGPYPTKAPGSVCELRTFDSEGNELSRQTLMYQEAPNREFEQAGWVLGTDSGDEDAVSGSVTCEQYTGPGWAVTSEPHLVRDDGKVYGASARLEWRGPQGFTASASCYANFVDDRGEVVYRGSAKLEPLWRPSELRNYPYRKTILVSTRGRSLDASRVEDFGCKTL